MLEQPLVFPGCSSIHFFGFISLSPVQLVGLAEVAYHLLCSVCVALAGSYAAPLVARGFPPGACLGGSGISFRVVNLLPSGGYCMMGFVYVLGAAADCCINHLSLVLGSLFGNASGDCWVHTGLLFYEVLGLT